MDHVTCGKCGAAFDLTPELPPVFTCGSCGAEVSRSARPAAAARSPAQRAAPPQRSAARGAPRPARSAASHHYRDAVKEPATKSKALLYSLIGGGAVALILVAYFVFGTSSSGGSAEKPAAPPAAAKPPEAKSESAAVETKPVEVVAGGAAKPAETSEAPKAEVDETGSREMVRFKLAMRGAQSAQQHFDAAQSGKAQRDGVKKATPESAELPEFDQRINAELEKAIKADPDFAPAHLDLGHVKYSKAEADKWLASDMMPTKLKTALEETVATADLEREAEKSRRGLATPPDAVWLSGPLAEKCGVVLAEVKLLHEDRGSTKVNWFYAKAKSAAARIEGEIGHYFVDDKNADAFDAVIFRPYVIMVQKDPQRRSVDRGYEIVQLFRMLEDTWRRRYGKEIEFSGSMAAPPIILLRSQADYAKYITRHEVIPIVSAGHYEPGERRMVIYHSTPDDERNVVFHEGTHVLMDHKNTAKDGLTQSNQSMWFNEGIAEYFGGHGPTGEKDPVTGSIIYEPGRVNDTRIGSIAFARAMKKLIKFDELIKITRAEWNAKNKDRLWAEMTYAQGWALVYYLNHGEGGKYQKDFIEYMKLELTGKSGMDTFKEVFGKYGLDKIEKGYTDFLDYIIKKKGDKKIVGGKIVD
jgi:hypothetical protein